MPHVVVEVDPALRSLLPRRDRGSSVVREPAATETVAHLLQILGVPVTEVGGASVDGGQLGREALRTTHMRNSSAVFVSPRTRPQPNSGRFLLDVHLGTLARRMRLLGIDAAYEPDADDARLAARSAAEERELLTRDRGLLFRKNVHDGALVRSDDVDKQLDEVLSRFAPRLAPWTLCLRCGATLAEVPAAEVAAELEPGTRRSYQSFRGARVVARCIGAACTADGLRSWCGGPLNNSLDTGPVDVARARIPEADMPTFSTTIHSNGGTTAGIEVPQDVVAALGAGKRPLVKVTLDGRYTFSYTLGVMGGRTLIGLSGAHRKASGFSVGDEVEVDVELDRAPREVVVPPELVAAFATDPAAETAWESLSFSARKEHARSIDEAKAPETRARRVEKALGTLRA